MRRKKRLIFGGAGGGGGSGGGAKKGNETRDKEVRIHGPTAKSSGVNERGNAALIVMDSHNCYD